MNIRQLNTKFRHIEHLIILFMLTNAPLVFGILGNYIISKDIVKTDKFQQIT
ncbi:hypothetical protein H8356DRAFT_1283947 [Neocallimastix lanati (nom. inval.)]|uniref:Uncharacterized protein n=1 Tax=Neocallimastix californiae TaxID=1754190 RepID=A0A1Y1ZUC4_9FUNG|nr:hypothetical protein H8356DRAFT_1283947 [Neocallimastix sp. JGI-2020a]ORY13657.1 hypothetical protein LY90DRAFT_437481 [Neocallimastix californiae]|eukprot:ORY13657.1 hypothetical protein LY90DRAFT_437481 [Neocallimastix californiae]